MSDTVQTMGALSGEAEDKARAKEIADRRRRKAAPVAVSAGR